MRALCIALAMPAWLLTACDSSTAPVPNDVEFVAIRAGAYQACALTEIGELYCWGRATVGVPATDSVCIQAARDCRTTPSRVLQGFRFREVELAKTIFGASACGITTANATYCWGVGLYGYDNGWVIDTIPPTPLAPSIPFQSISVASRHMCGVTASHAVYCWGDYRVGVRGTGSPLADIYVLPDLVPNLVAGHKQFNSVTVGLGQSCALDTGGAAYCWGSAIALGTTSAMLDSLDACGYTVPPFTGACSHTPVSVDGGHRFVALVAGEAHTCGLTPSGAVLCWGDNSAGQLGTGDTLFASAPTPVLLATPAAQLRAGKQVTCAILVTGEAYCWGANGAGQLGHGTVSDHESSPVRVLTSARYVDLAVGDGYGCGMSAGGAIDCWGANDWGQLGTGDLVGSPTPRPVVRH